MLRKGYVFLLVVFLCETLTGCPAIAVVMPRLGNRSKSSLWWGSLFLFFALFSFFPFHTVVALRRMMSPEQP